MTHYHPEDRPDPSEQPLRARVPDHISGGAFSTGVIVMTAQSEFILDFVQNLGRPHQIVARIVMPHNVLPQLVDALQRNMELYRSRWGELPQTGSPQQSNAAPSDVNPGRGASHGLSAEKAFGTEIVDAGSPSPSPANPATAGGPSASPGSGGGGAGPDAGSSSSPNAPAAGETSSSSKEAGDPAGKLPPAGSGARQASAQEVYDDLKIKDELLSGSYANAVMIGHGPHEFSFDFITNFYPHSAVSSRVFLAAGQVPRLYDSLKGTWDQLRKRMQPPGGSRPDAGPKHEDPPSPPEY